VSRDLEKAFVVNWALLQVAGGITENLGYLRYTGSNKLYVHSITLSTEEPGTGLTKFGIWVNCTASGGSARIPNNMNLGSALLSETDCYTDEDGTGTIITLSGGMSIQTIRLSGSNSFTIDFSDALIVPQNKVIAIKANSATTGTKVRATLKFFEE